MLRGTAAGLEFVFAGRPFEEAWTEIADRLAERPDFYRGSQATAIFDGVSPDELGMERFLEVVRGYGITLRGVHGNDSLEPVAERHAIAFLGEPPRPTVASFERKRAAPISRAAARGANRRSRAPSSHRSRAFRRRRSRSLPYLRCPAPSIIAARCAVAKRSRNSDRSSSSAT